VLESICQEVPQSSPPPAQAQLAVAAQAPAVQLALARDGSAVVRAACHHSGHRLLLRVWRVLCHTHVCVWGGAGSILLLV